MNGIAFEVWITRRLRRPDLFCGVTDPAARRERIRQAILDGAMGEAIAGKRKDAECETWAQLFERVYGEALTGRAAA